MTEIATPIAVVILAAGQGSRMRSSLPKVLHAIGGRPMVGHLLDRATDLAANRTVLVVGAHGDAVAEAAATLSHAALAIARQDPPRGTADAVMQALPGLEGFQGVVLVLYADTPLVQAETLRRMAAHASQAKLCVLGFEPDEPGAYGRVIQSADGALERIVEAKDATSDELQIRLCNSGVMAIDADTLRAVLPRVGDDNAKGEFYLTDIVGLARADGAPCAVVVASADDVLGVNARDELAAAEAAFQRRRRGDALANGVTLVDPETVYFSHDTIVGPDVVIEPNVFFGPGVIVKRGARIKAFSHIEGASIGEEATIGPFARLRPGVEIDSRAKIGNFVEIKKAHIGENAKISHLTYIGDATVGAEANIGAGAVTCNYDGVNKHQTRIEEGAFIGSNTSLVAPVTIAAGAYVGSGSVITRNVAANGLAIARARQKIIEGWAEKFRRGRAGGGKGE